MSKVDDVAWMCHMLEAARETLRFTQEKKPADLEQDEVLQLALVRLFGIVGEAPARVFQKTQRRYDQMPSAKIIGMRNRLVHGYDNLVDQLEGVLPAGGNG